MSTLLRPSRRGHWALAILGGVIVLLGLVLLAGGAWLATLGGSWYYAPAGLAMLIAGVLLFRGRNAGAWWFAAVVAATLLWTWWESGSDYWRWVPRLGLIVGLAFVLALLLPKLERPVSRAVSRSVAGGLAVVFVVAFALAFVPFGITEAEGALTQVAGIAAGVVNRPADGAQPAQPANAPVDDDWAAYGRSQAGQRYSPLTQINRDNVSQLQQAWVFHTGDVPTKRWGAETTPLKVGDSLYLCSARNQVIALDASTGKQRWRYDPKVKDEAIPYTAACRGVSYYEVPTAAPAANDAAASQAATAPALCRTRVIEGTLDGRLIALDARTGTPCADFGTHGQVDITVGMGETPPGYISINSPPAIVRGVVVIGHQVLDGQKRYEPSGVIQGFDAVTGQLRWAWDMTHPEWNGAPPPGQTWTRGTPTCGPPQRPTSSWVTCICRWAIPPRTTGAARARRRKTAMPPRWWRWM